MAVPFRKIIMRRSSVTHDGSGSDSVPHNAKNKSIHEISQSGVEVCPSKFRSPPPKPPRRRHSDQLSVPPSGTFPSNRKKNVDGNQTLLTDTIPKISSNKSGCGSLPANWTADFHGSPGTDDTTLFRSSGLIPSNKFEQAYHSSTSNNSISDKCITSLNESTTCNELESVNFNCTQRINQPYVTQPLKPESVPNNYIKNFQQQHCINGNVENVSNRNILIESSNNDNDLHNLKSFQKELHRRHHSDPLLSRFDRSLKRSTFLKICAQRSNSFKGCGTSSNKFYNSLEHCTMSKEVQCLYEEIKILKEMNDKLWEHLCSVQATLDNFKKSSEDQGSLSVSEILSHLYYAQKAKDCAIEERLRIALEDRDAAVVELEEMVQAVARSFEDNDSVYGDDEASDKEIKELLQEIEITQNPAKLLQQQRLLLSYLYRSKEAKQERLSHELRLSLAERDNALEKVKQLEDELKHMKLSNDIWHSDTKHWETSLLNILCQVIEQRDSNLLKNDSLQEMNHYKGYRSPRLQKSMSGGHHTNSDYESLQKHEVIITCPSDANAAYKCFQASTLDAKKCLQFSLDSQPDEIKSLKEEIGVLTKSLEEEVKSRENAEENCLRLERLVNVLRKKINGQHVGVPV